MCVVGAQSIYMKGVCQVFTDQEKSIGSRTTKTDITHIRTHML